MPPVVPAVASTGPAPSVTTMLVLGVVLAVVGVVILLRLYRPKRLDERIRTRRGLRAEGSTAALGGSGVAHCHGGFDSGSGGFEGGSFDGGGGGGGPC
jgi:uncharacterized membrane protein YgcG